MITTEFNRGVVRPVECLKAGWALIKDQYWLFFGIVVVGMIIASFGPVGILLGPMFCGIYLCFFAKMRGEPVKFELLFKGFDYFGQSVLAGIVQVVPMAVLMFLAYIPMFAMPIFLQPDRNSEPNPAVIFGFVGAVFLLIFIAITIGGLITMLFIFTFPLIVERKLSAIDALKTSARAVLGNIGGMLGLWFCSFLVHLAGAMLCFVGVYLAIPITMAGYAIAYRKIFPETQTQMPPLPHGWQN